jgi:hypothetical protein
MDRRLLDDESSLGHLYLKRRVVEIAAAAALKSCRQRLVDATVQSDEVASGAER